MRANKCFLIRLPNWFSMCLDSDKKILPLCYKHVVAMSSRKIRGKFHQLVFQKFVVKAPKRYLSVGADLVLSSSFLGCIAIFCRFLFQANLACFNDIHQNVNALVFRDKVE